jgi:hypothetical protein
VRLRSTGTVLLLVVGMKFKKCCARSSHCGHRHVGSYVSSVDMYLRDVGKYDLRRAWQFFFPKHLLILRKKTSIIIVISIEIIGMSGSCCRKSKRRGECYRRKTPSHKKNHEVVSCSPATSALGVNNVCSKELSLLEGTNLPVPSLLQILG